MSSQLTRKRKSDQMDDTPGPGPGPGPGPSTPTGSPIKKMKMSESQKQALMDNLQLEITERARQLRAHYALQCSDLRSRIERRINRVPISLRKMKMGQLMAQHQSTPGKVIPHSPMKQQLEDRLLPPMPSPSKLPSPVRQGVIQSPKTRKRKSSAILIPSDKENHEPDSFNISNSALENLPVQKNSKRPKTTEATAPPIPKRNASRPQKKPLKNSENPTGVLSPRSHNSRTLPRSPIKDKDLPLPPVREASPLRQQAPQSPTRPFSPSKPASPFKAATSAISAFAKRGYAAAGAAAGAAGARLTRPSSREKEQSTLSGTGTIIPGSPTGKMLPPPRPALATLTGTHASAFASTSSILTLSPQRTASQSSMRSNTSDQSSTSTNVTVVTKPSRGILGKKTAALARAPTKKIASATHTTTAAAAKTRGKVVVVSGSTVSAVSPKATGVRRAQTTAATGTTKRAAITSAIAKKTAGATAATTATGRVLRKRNQ